ncbi:16477_t:CDS:2 [Dentiscutata erythropus]|uniref:16477_t:CDS:1 n=1 Tax=Dentiscutata erythropus TaxID=1348616 RepID=A0A9N9AAX0_9GLOM|nr:16477_t:CDS:2 [Dentiscutata erythropus]
MASKLPVNFDDESNVVGNMIALVDSEFNNMMIASVGMSSSTPMIEIETIIHVTVVLKEDSYALSIHKKGEALGPAHKLGFDVHRIASCPNNSSTPISNYNTTLPMEENLTIVSPEWFYLPSLPILSSIYCEVLNSSSTLEVNNNQCFFMNN